MNKEKNKLDSLVPYAKKFFVAGAAACALWVANVQNEKNEASEARIVSLENRVTMVEHENVRTREDCESVKNNFYELSKTVYKMSENVARILGILEGRKHEGK